MADESYIYGVVAGDAGVQALLGTTPTRVFDGRHPETLVRTTPYVVANVISRVPENDMEGAAGVDSFRIQFDIIATTTSAANGVLSALRTALNSYGYELTTQKTVEESTDLRRIITDWSFWLAR